jgi:hypothetical protein
VIIPDYRSSSFLKSAIEAGRDPCRREIDPLTQIARRANNGTGGGSGGGGGGGGG